jgi:LmbE family N-acetylglucosaminyl deacetylase
MQVNPSRATDRQLPPWRSVLVVVAHPDDESFGLGAVICAFIEAGARVSVLCFTQGEASTLCDVTGDLAEVRAGELTAAAHVLGMTSVQLLTYADGGLNQVDATELADHVRSVGHDLSVDGLLVFDTTGITGHPDHIAATQAAVDARSALGVDVLAWTLAADVADQLRTEFGADFRGRSSDEIDLTVTVDRTRQRQAVECHPSQAVPGSALWRRLELQGEIEYLRWI